MRNWIAAIVCCLAVSACGARGEVPSISGLSNDEVASMSKATQDKYCAVLTEVEAGEIKGQGGLVVDRVVQLASAVITDQRSISSASATGAKELNIPVRVARNWKLTAPCIVWRQAASGDSDAQTLMAVRAADAEA